MDYCATHHDAELCYHVSDMIFLIHRYASYLSEIDTRSRTGGIFS